MHICLYISPLDIHLFISIFAQLEKDCVTCTFSISIFHFPFAICISVTVAAAAAAESPFSLGRKIKCKANFSLFAWGTWRKNAKLFCNAAAEQSWKCTYVCVCGTWHVLNWIYTCAELIRVPCNDVFQFQLAAAAADVPQESKKKQHEAKKKLSFYQHMHHDYEIPCQACEKH